jgi:acid phosphatase type 7
MNTRKNVGARQSYVPPVAAPATAAHLQTQADRSQLPDYPFQPLPKPTGLAPFRFDLKQLLPAAQVQGITAAGSMVFHSVGDTGDYRGQQMDFVAAMMTQDFQSSSQAPAFFYHLGDVVYFAGDIDKYGDNFYATYKDYPGYIVAISGNHDCQPDDPLDGPVDPTKVPFDGWVQNFMSTNNTQLGSNKTGAGRTQMDLPNVYWTFTTPLATIIGLCSNVGESQAEIKPNQVAWFIGELKAANPNLALIVTIHHPPFSGDTDHSGSSVAEQVLFKAFQSANRYPNLILSGHVHNYQRFTQIVTAPKGTLQIPCIVAGAGGYTVLSKLPMINGAYPQAPLSLENNLTLEQYDQDNLGFLRFEVSKTQIVGTYFSAPYVAGGVPAAQAVDRFTIDLVGHTIKTLS